MWRPEQPFRVFWNSSLPWLWISCILCCTDQIREAKYYTTSLCSERQHGNKHAKLLCFYVNLTSDISGSQNTWVVSTKPQINPRNFMNQTDTLPCIVAPLKALAVTCAPFPFPRGQRCANWFVLRQFRVTSTVAVCALSQEENIPVCMGCSPHAFPDKNLVAPFRYHYDLKCPGLHQIGHCLNCKF